ncbi:hypothetical protein GH714_021078 [Hevea brasiliensis]|uniref:DEK-C domain-containing protein n=1 Tax=Hevea brasiliensis TaxID=3981 RepID=A0A6A6NJ66_HEVBR|nr:hypothetical protein GH714_021078 [Hevea brasiliensis]
MEPEIQLKIQEAVFDILKKADMDEMTEFKVRVAASERLGIDLSDIHCKRFIRGLVESFLLSTMEVGAEDGKEADAMDGVQVKTREMAREGQEAMHEKEFDGMGNHIICKLSKKRNVVIQDFKGKSSVWIREFYHKDGRQVPTNKGISLTAEQWSAFRKSVPLIEEAIMKMTSNLRSNPHCELNEQIFNLVTASTPCEFNRQVFNMVTASTNVLSGEASNLVIASTPCELNRQISNMATSSTRRLNGEASNLATASMPHNEQVSTSVTNSTPNEHNGQVTDSVIASSLREFIPFDINRFDGKNYQFWAPHMELFLNKLKIAYVLTDPCPTVAIRPEASAEEIAQAKAAEKKWFNDDHLCRHNILSSLSDALYYQYSKKTKSARELWEELKLVYLYEEFGKKRSQVRNYIEFQIVDERPVLDQVQELNNIADSIVASGMFFDEKFHVSVIISKLPPSWKGFCIKLMCEEYLPFRMLMDHVRMEEESRNQEKQLESSNSACFNHAKNLGPRMRDMKKPRMNGKRLETERDNKALVCHFCEKRGHISKHCRNRKFDKEANEKLDEEKLLQRKIQDKCFTGHLTKVLRAIPLVSPALVCKEVPAVFSYSLQKPMAIVQY